MPAMTASRTFLIAAALAAVTGGGWLLSSQRPDPGAGKSEAKALPVVTRLVQAQSVPVLVEAVGTVQAQTMVPVRPRVEGAVTGVHFTEGQDVVEGARLFTLDARAAEAARRQAEANLARDRAQAERAHADLARYSELARAGNATRQRMEQAISDAAQLDALVKADQAAIDNARLTIEYANIRAPVSGRTGAINAKLGTLAKPGDGQPMVTITQLQPINVAFSVAEKHLARVRAAMRRGPLDVLVKSVNDPELAAHGRLTFLDSAIDTNTGTILMKATFTNEDLRLWPGQFVTVTLSLGAEADALTIPAEAVQSGQSGTFVFIVDDGGRAAVRPVTVDRVLDGIAVLGGGVQDGDRVVVQGQMRLAPGLPVAERKPVADPMPAKPGQIGTPPSR